MVDRRVGTKVHTFAAAEDPAALFPLQEALGYDLAESLFAQPRNLALEGLTDFWYLEATSELLRSAGLADLNDRIELIPCSGAGKLVYYTAILHSHKLKVAALFATNPSGGSKPLSKSSSLTSSGIEELSEFAMRTQAE